MATWKKVGLGVGGVVVVAAVVGGLWLSDLLSFDTSDEAGVSFSTVESVVPDVLSCLNDSGESEGVAKELIDLADDVVSVNAGVDRLMTDAEWEDYSPRLPWSKNVNRNTTFTDHCFYRSPSVPADCVGDACQVVTEHDGYDWTELSIIRSQDCLPTDDAGCSTKGVDPGAISVTVTSKCHRVVWEDEIVELTDPDGNRYVLHATETGEVDFGVELPDGWRLETVVLDEPLVVSPFGGGDNCYHNVLRDNAGQGYHQYVFASATYPATSS